ncbi:hypothetical protein Tco_0574090 [Tanacetum coccineum]
MTTAGTRAVVNTGKGKMDTDLKVKGNPEILLQDHAMVTTQAANIKDLKAQIKQQRRRPDLLSTITKFGYQSSPMKKRLARKKKMESISKQGRKTFKYTEDAHDEGTVKDSEETRVSTEDPVSTAKPKVSTDKLKVSTDKQKQIQCREAFKKKREKSSPLRQEPSFSYTIVCTKEDFLAQQRSEAIRTTPTRIS